MQDVSTAITSNLFSYYDLFAMGSGESGFKTNHLVAFTFEQNMAFLNVAVFSGEIKNLETEFNHAKHFFKNHGISEFTFWCNGPRLQDMQNPHSLLGEYKESLTGMALDCSDQQFDLSLNCKLDFEIVDSKKSLERWSKETLLAYELPAHIAKDCVRMYWPGAKTGELIHVLGKFNGDVVAVAQIFISNGVAGLYWIATMPNKRRNGFGTEITEKCHQIARNRGCQTVVLHSTDSGFPLYKALGYKEFLRLGNWMCAC